MTWQKILASQTNANSPLNQPLFDSIRTNLESLAESLVLVSLEVEKSVSFVGSWTAVKSGRMFVPKCANSLEASIECMVNTTTSGRKIRLKVENGAGGFNLSTEAEVPVAGYDYVNLDCPAEGDLVGAGAWRKWWIEVNHSESVSRTFSVRDVVIRVKSA